MSHKRPELTQNKHQDLLDDINKLFISIKLLGQSGDSVENVKKFYPIPDNIELDALHRRILSAFQEFEKPYRTERPGNGWGGGGG